MQDFQLEIEEEDIEVEEAGHEIPREEELYSSGFTEDFRALKTQDLCPEFKLKEASRTQSH